MVKWTERLTGALAARGRLVPMVAIGMVVAACSDERLGTTGPETVVATRSVTVQQDRDRKDTPWQRLTDAELAQAVSAVSGRVIIGFKDSSAVGGVDNGGRVLATAGAVQRGRDLLESHSITIRYEFRRIPAVAATISPELVSLVRNNPYVDYLEPSGSGEWAAQVTPWNIDSVKAPAAHSYTTGSGVKTLILDSGVDLSHGDLNVQAAWRCVNFGLPTTDAVGHGTHVAGIAAALDNSTAVLGVAPDVYLMSANVDVGGAPDTEEVACSIDVARLNSVFVANMSFVIPPSTAVTDEINGGYNTDGMLFVAAAGNSSGGAVGYPASLSNVIAVGALDSTKTYAGFQAVGTAMELTAPGVSILSTSLASGSQCSTGGSTALCSGTSMGSAHVAGAAALVKAYNPTWTNAQVRARLTGTATDLGSAGRDSYYGYGLINLAAAIP